MNSDKNSVNLNEIIKAAKSQKPSNESEMKEFLNNNLSSSQSERLMALLSDKEKTRTILESKEGAELLKKLGGGNKNG